MKKTFYQDSILIQKERGTTLSKIYTLRKIQARLAREE
jgi:hypothetical protein